VAYLKDMSLNATNSVRLPSGSSWQDLLNPNFLLQSFTVVAFFRLRESANRMKHSVTVTGLSPANAWNENMTDLIDTAEAHCNRFMLEIFLQKLPEVSEKKKREREREREN
jgi:hypothetical protein